MPAQPLGHLAVPSSGTGRPVLVLHPWWGLNPTIREFCDRLAAEGFVVFAPDLYRGEIATDIPAAESLSTALFRARDRAKADVDSSVAFLVERAGSDAAAVMLADQEQGGLALAETGGRQILPELGSDTVHAELDIHGPDADQQ